MHTRTFWKGEVGVDGQVKDRDKLYNVRLEIKGSYVNSYSCSCTQGNSYKEMCSHEKALFQYYQKQASPVWGAPVSTSSQVRTMIREYTNSEVDRILREDKEEQVRFQPKIIIGRQGIRAEFRLGRDRMYVIRDLMAFARAMEQGSRVEYGKNLGFYHRQEVFSEDSQELLTLVLELLGNYREYYAQFQKSVFSPAPVVRELNITRVNRDRFLGMLVGQEVESEDQKGEGRKLRVVRENPDMVVTVRKAGEKGLKVSLDRELVAFSGERHLYVLSGSCLYVCDEELTRDGSIFFRQMTEGFDAPYEVTVGERDVPLFYERVLKKLEPYGILDARGIELEQARPEELKARFVVESPRAGELILRPELSYGDYAFHPMEDEHVPRTICRDVPGEFRISQVLTRYFKYRDLETNDLVIRDDEEELFRFLSQGVEELKKLGTVFIPQDESHLKILAPQKVSVGVQVTGQWLELTVDAGDMTSQDLENILQSYKMKKAYYRLKTGEFLKLEDNGLMTAAKLTDGLVLSKKEQGEQTVRLPRYRAFYLDSLCRDREDILFTRDAMYRSIIRGMKSVDDSDFEVPVFFEHVLRGYQRTGFKWLRTLDFFRL